MVAGVKRSARPEEETIYGKSHVTRMHLGKCVDGQRTVTNSPFSIGFRLKPYIGNRETNDVTFRFHGRPLADLICSSVRETSDSI